MQQTFGNNKMKTHNVRVEYCRHKNFGTSRRVTATLDNNFLSLSSEEAERARDCLIVLDDFSLHPDYCEASFILKSGGSDAKFKKRLFVGKALQIRFTFPNETIRYNWQGLLLSIPRKNFNFKTEDIPNCLRTATLESLQSLQWQDDALQAQRPTVNTNLKWTPNNRRPKSKSARNHGQMFSPPNLSKRKTKSFTGSQISAPNRYYTGSRSISTSTLNPEYPLLNPIIEEYNRDAIDTPNQRATVDNAQPPVTPNLAASLAQKIHDSTDTESKTYEESKADVNEPFAGDIWKRGDKLPFYRRRYAEIRGKSEFVYYLSRDDCPHNPRGRASLAGGKLTLQQSLKNRFQITLLNGTKFSFQTSEATYKQWVARFMRAVRDDSPYHLVDYKSNTFWV